MVPVTITGSSNIIKKGSVLINPGSVQIRLSPAVTTHLQKKDGGEILDSIRNTILENQRQATIRKEL
jgi:hypothetical protein